MLSYQFWFLQDILSSIFLHTNNSSMSILNSSFHCIWSSLCQCSSHRCLMSYTFVRGSSICNCYYIKYMQSSRRTNSLLVIHCMCHMDLCIRKHSITSFSQIQLGKRSRKLCYLPIICSTQFYKQRSLLQKQYKLVNTQHHKLSIY